MRGVGEVNYMYVCVCEFMFIHDGEKKNKLGAFNDTAAATEIDL